MIRGTNPTHIFEIPFDTAIVKKARIIYKQNGAEILRKETKDCVFEGKAIGIKLTQEESMMFDHDENMRVQLRILTTEGDSYVSTIKYVRVGECMDNEVI